VNNIIAQRWQWRRLLPGIQCDDVGDAVFEFQAPESPAFFTALSAEESDGCGLSDGYKAWFHYSGHRMIIARTDMDSDGDGMKDGWEVEYGLNPTDGTGNNGCCVDLTLAQGDPRHLDNQHKHNAYYAATQRYDAATTLSSIRSGAPSSPSPRQTRR